MPLSTWSIKSYYCSINVTRASLLSPLLVVEFYYWRVNREIDMDSLERKCFMLTLAVACTVGLLLGTSVCLFLYVMDVAS